ncbi:hypothetical protein ACFLZJ_02215, partial [Nanoarchaeota archaeon]
YGTGAGVSTLDILEAGNIQSNLQSYMGGGSTVSEASVTGEAVSLDTSSTRIWLNTSLNTAKATLTKSDLPTVLADYTFSGNVEAKMTSTIKMGAGNPDGVTEASPENGGVVIFYNMPKSSSDPVVGLSLGSTAATNAILYNASATFKATNFTHADSEGENIQLFGRDFVISTATSTTELVLFSSAVEVALSVGGDAPTASTTATIGGTDYTVTLVTGSDTTATVSVGGEQKEITEGSSKKVGGIDVAVKSVTESEALNTIDATLLVGSEKITFTNGAAVTKGSDDDPVDGTTGYITGGTGAATSLTVAVYRASSSDDVLAAGESFVDPVFGSFKLDFVGLSSGFDDAGRDLITVENSGEDTMSITMTDSDSNEKSFDFAHNESGQWRLGDDGNYTLRVQEMANVTEDEYLILGNEDYGHLVQVTQIYNTTTGTNSVTGDKVTVQDVFSGESYSTVFSTTEGSGTLTIDGKAYTVTYTGAATPKAQFKYPTSDSASANALVFFPTIKTNGGALVTFYEPLVMDLSDADLGGSDLTTANFADGDGWTGITLDYTGQQNASSQNWTINSIEVIAGQAGSAEDDRVTMANATIGRFKYQFATAAANITTLYLTDPESGALISNPGVIVFEGKDDASEYEGYFVDLEDDPAGTANAGVGVQDVTFTDNRAHFSANMKSDSDITKDLDWYGTLVTTDKSDSDQYTITASMPAAQVYTQFYLGEVDATITGGGGTIPGGQLGDVTVKDSEVSSVSSKNLIVVGGSCINSAAAALVGGAHCGAAFTDATGVGSGQFLIKSYSGSTVSDKVALLVAGYEAADTVNAATYLRNQPVDTSSEYLGTSATTAELVVA